METKHFDTEASTTFEPTNCERESVDSAEDFEPNAARRRLMRGALVAAPVMLTLRSGALAAVSGCVSAKNTSVTTSGNGQLPSGIVNPPVIPGDQCILGTTTGSCEPGYVTKDGIGPYTQYAISGTSGNYQCGTTGSGNNPGTGVQVAILSANAANSFLLV